MDFPHLGVHSNYLDQTHYVDRPEVTGIPRSMVSGRTTGVVPGASVAWCGFYI